MSRINNIKIINILLPFAWWLLLLLKIRKEKTNNEKTN